MFLQIILIIIGIVGVVWGADKFTDGAASLAVRFHVPQIVIGLTIVALGTSLPEFCVSFASALKGTTDMAVGNIVGSNIFNTLMIVGCSAIVAPISVQKRSVKKDIPTAVIASALLAFLCIDSFISRWESVVLLVFFAAFMYYTVQQARSGKGETAESIAQMSLWKCLLLIVVGIACLIVGSNLFVDGAMSVARRFGVSEAVIGITVVAFGTSLPELATSVVAAKKGNAGLAIGNVVGSNVFNILLILGVTGVIAPMGCAGITIVDYAVLLLSVFLLWLFSFSKYHVERWEGYVLVAFYLCYVAWLIYYTVELPALF